ncbi:putative adipose-regulatory protein-domain-containing protein [Pilobolus umbonatus]|nr:putative adipose-regulatory protein-domain-containing protein [Pilobolus umbonatus]
MSRHYSDTDEFSDTGISRTTFQVVPDGDHEEYDEADSIQEDHELLPNEDTMGKQPTEEEEAAPVQWHPAIVMIVNTMKKVLSPIIEMVFAPETQRTLVKSLIVIIVIAWVLLTSFTAYLTFYQRYIPKTTHIEPIYFQYANSEYPEALIPLSGPDPYMPLRSDQAYAVSVSLHVPTSDINFDLGNFMVKVELQTEDNAILAQSSRPAILRYQSVTQRVINVLAKAAPLLIGWTEESQVIKVSLMESYIDRKSKPVTHARVTLSSQRLQVYDATLNVVADFHGLRYYMYHRKFITATVFILLFTVIEIMFAIVAWRVFGQSLWLKINGSFPTEDESTNSQVEEDVNVAGNRLNEDNTYHSDDDEYISED